MGQRAGSPAQYAPTLMKRVEMLDARDSFKNVDYRVETVPFRHVSFAETVEMVEFDPAVHAALSLAIEHNASAPNMAYRVHAAPAPMVEYDATLMMGASGTCGTCSHG